MADETKAEAETDKKIIHVYPLVKVSFSLKMCFLQINGFK